MNAADRAYADDAAAYMAGIDARNRERDRAERVHALLESLGDWTMQGDDEIVRCCACSHSVPKHDAACIAWRLALMLVDARARQLSL